MKSGSVVMSLTGKEKSKFYVVTDFDEHFCYLANGRDRKLAKPKKKNLRHVAETKTVLTLEQMSSDKVLCEAIRSFCQNDEVN